MSSSNPPLPAIDEVRQANRLFLEFLRQRPAIAAGDFGLSQSATGLLGRATARQLEQAADFPRALFRLSLPAERAGTAMNPLGLARDPARRVLQATLLHSAWNLSRTSAYSARLLLRLDDADILRFRAVEMQDILAMSLADGVLRAAFDEFDWIWQRLLTESRPEYRRRLLLIGLQPEDTLHAAVSLA